MSNTTTEKTTQQATISTHNGSDVKFGHNRRDVNICSKEEHIDLTRPHETWVDIPLGKAYKDIFGDALKEYNEKQSRPERRIKNYLGSIYNDPQRHPVYEMIIGVYPGRDENGNAKLNDNQEREILKRFTDDWNRRNPNLKLVGAYYHNDEKGEDPHVHIDYVPVAHGYTRGMKVQNGLNRALEEMGFKSLGKNTAQIQWEKRENQALESIVREYGIDVIHPQTTQEKAKHLSKLDYIISQKEAEIEAYNNIAEYSAEEIEEYLHITKVPLKKGYVMLPEEDKNRVVNALKFGYTLDDRLKDLRHKKEELDKKEKQLV
jgi:hypothetical protein